MIAVDSVLSDTIREHADVVFPAEAYAEKEGTVTHPDGRVQRLRPAIGRPKAQGGESGSGVRPLWQVLADVAERAGLDLGVRTGPMASKLLFEAVPFYAGLTLDAIGGRGVRWPASEAAALVRGRRPGSPPSSRCPTRCRRRPTARCASARSARCGAPRRSTSRRRCASCARARCVELSPVDADRLGIREGDQVEVGRERDGARQGRGQAARRGARRLGVHRRRHARPARQRADRADGGGRARHDRLRRGRLLRAVVDPDPQGAS